jgi:hypothetical protein
MRLGSGIGMGQARRWTGVILSVGVLGARSVSGDYSTDLCKHTSSGIFARREILHSTKSKHHLDMENLVSTPSGPSCERAAAASEFGGLALTTSSVGVVNVMRGIFQLFVGSVFCIRRAPTGQRAHEHVSAKWRS